MFIKKKEKENSPSLKTCDVQEFSSYFSVKYPTLMLWNKFSQI